jgi:hypothetical protein
LSSEVQQYLALDESELLMEIARLADPRAPLSNPEHRRAAGYAVVEGQLGRIRGIICPRRELIDSPEFELATVIIGALLDHLTLGLASAIAAYIAKRGVLWLCRDQEAQATA